MFEQLGTPVAVVMTRETWAEKGLDAHCVYLISEHLCPETGETKEFSNLLDAHWQEATAWECISRWAKRYAVPIRARINIRKAVVSE